MPGDNAIEAPATTRRFHYLGRNTVVINEIMDS